MTGLLAVLSIILIAIIIVQIGKVTELAAKIRGEEEAEMEINNRNALWSIVFMVVFLIACVVSAVYYKNSILWYGPHTAASAHGGELDSLFNTTLFFTGIVFIVTHILLFWFAYKYRSKKGRKVLYMPHDTRLEIIWTMVPAVVMSFLVIKGLVAWNEVMADVGEDEDYIEIEATGMQFLWTMRYPGPDGALGRKYYKNITAVNALGQDWEDTKNLDDIVSSAAGEVIKLPINKKVRVRITARDVLHNFDLPHFRVKMDAIPGLPTYFAFTPNITTEEYRERLGALDKEGNPLYPEWHEPADPEDAESKARWEEFNFELACAELCGSGHYSMRRVIEVVSEEEWKAWMDEQKSFYLMSIRNTDEDPYKGKLLSVEVQQRSQDFRTAVDQALASDKEEDKIIRLEYVTFETGSAQLTQYANYQLEDLAKVMKSNENIQIAISGHTDNVGEPEANLSLSTARAQTVYDYLTEKGDIEPARLTSAGYGETQPIADNTTEDGRQENRRTEFKIVTQ
ncbi:MAG: OmpA family protein [Bacteroidota bacterium]